MKIVKFAAVALCALVAFTASAQTKKKPGHPAPVPVNSPPPPGPENVRAKVETLLSGYEYVPTNEDWKRVGPGALDVLVQIANDPAQLPTRRTRAVASMAQVENPKATDTLLTLANDSKVEVRYRSTAVEALGAKLGDAALPKVSPLLNAKDAELREASARAIARMNTADARKTLESRLEKEQDPAVRDALQRGLKTTP